jgi:hypothetical protein
MMAIIKPPIMLPEVPHMLPITTPKKKPKNAPEELQLVLFPL